MAVLHVLRFFFSSSLIFLFYLLLLLLLLRLPPTVPRGKLPHRAASLAGGGDGVLRFFFSSSLIFPLGYEGKGYG